MNALTYPNYQLQIDLRGDDEGVRVFINRDLASHLLRWPKDFTFLTPHKLPGDVFVCLKKKWGNREISCGLAMPRGK